MEGSDIVQFLSEYGYWIILPLMIIEGPIVTIIAAFMASLGIFNIGIVFALSLIGDIIGDILFYGAGRAWGMLFVQKIGRHIGITHTLVKKMEHFFTHHGGKTIFAVKSTTGLCWATFTAAGIVKMPFWRFVKYSFLGGVVWSAALVALGYFFGELYSEISRSIAWAGWIVAAIAIVLIVGINIYKKKKAQDLFTHDQSSDKKREERE